MNVLAFIIGAMVHGKAYIDCDGCILERYRVPPELGLVGIDNLLWWAENLQPTPIIKSRIALCYLLRFLGVQLILWTNRDQKRHEAVTRRALGKHCRLFDFMLFRSGLKIQDRLSGPVMEDDERFLACGTALGLLVKSR